MWLFADAEMTISAETHTFIVGDHVYGIMHFRDPSVSKYLNIENFYYNPACCGEYTYPEDKHLMTNIHSNAGWLTALHYQGATVFEFITFKPVPSAEVISVATIHSSAPADLISTHSHLAYWVWEWASYALNFISFLFSIVWILCFFH